MHPVRTLALAALSLLVLNAAHAATWTADNGNGTFTNPLFYDEFSDPDMIRVGEDYYLTGTTMHAMPGLPILHSRDLVNWEFLTYASDRLDFGPQYRLEDGKTVYGQGIWAPSFRYYNGTFYIFTNVNGRATQVFRATDPRGPWTRTEIKTPLHDVSVHFDDDGRIWAVWGYQGIQLAELKPDLSDIIPGSQREIIAKGSGMGEGVHLYKLNGKYFLLSAWYEGRMRMAAARADRMDGPWEVNPSISTDEDFGLMEGYRLGRGETAPYPIIPPNPAPNGRMSLHQGGIVSTPAGEWWGFSMMDYNSVGRLLGLSPITWKGGWPYFGLPGNLERTPRTWVKPNTGHTSAPRAPYERSDDFSGKTLKPVWQWNHVPVDGQWSLSERPGFLRLHAQPAKDFWFARNTLTQRSIGPMSRPTATLELGGLKAGDVAGLALLNRPYAWIGVEKTPSGLAVVQFDEQTGKRSATPITATRIWLRADCDFMTEKARFSYSLDGKTFRPLGDEFTMVFQLRTFQGVRYSLFNYSTTGAVGGYADFDAIDIHEPHPKGLMRPIPYGKAITLTAHGRDVRLTAKGGAVSAGTGTAFKVVDAGLGRVFLAANGQHLSVGPTGAVSLREARTTAESFQWIETPTGELVLMSLTNHRFLRIDPATGAVIADSPGPQSDGNDGVRFDWASP
jgi:beta-xylosidase